MSGPLGSQQWMYNAGAEFYDFPLEQSLRFNDNDSAYLSWTPASAGNRKTWTWSGWVKRGNLGGFQYLFASGNTTPWAGILFSDNATNSRIQVSFTAGSSAGTATSAEFRDVSSWYHIVLAVDTTQATAANRIKLYVNGNQITEFASTNYPALNFDTQINNNILHTFGRQPTASSSYFDGYLAEVNFIDGQQLDPTSFGEFKSGIWIPKDPTGLTYGTNGFRLNFADTVTASGFNTVTWTGNNTNGGNSVNGVGFSPDLVWAKCRSVAYSPLLYDSIRGTGATAELKTDGTELEGGSSSSERGYLNSFDSDGFSSVVGSNGDNLYFNQSGQTYVGWCWDAGSGSPVSNTDGSITSTVKANTDYGFSVLTYTGNATAGATLGHSLGVAPDVIITKGRGAVSNWFVYHSANTSQPETEYLTLETTNATTDNSTVWNDTAPTSSVFSIGQSGWNNTSGVDYVAYCFAEKTGYSKFGSYTGTGAAGNSITLGFKPAFLLIKETGNANSWELFDNTRNTSSPFDKRLFPNSSQAEATTTSLSYSDTGFETLNGNTGINRSGGTYIYMAFADTRDAAFWRDTSGQGNDWQPNNLTFSDVVPDSATNNFATINNLASLGGMTFFEGNTIVRHADIAAYNHARSTMGMTSGKWYWEWYNSGSSGDAPNLLSGIVNDNVPVSTSNGYVGQNTNSYGWNGTGGERYYNGTNIGTIAIPTGDSSGIYMVAYDADSGSLYFGKNGTWANSGNPATGTGALFTGIDTDTTWYPAGYTINNDAGRWRDVVVNHGQDSTFAGATAAGGNADENGYGDFAYAPPSGFLALCSANLPKGAIDTLADETPTDYFGTALWTGNGGSSQTISGLGFQGDFTWHKQRNGAQNHLLMDTVRGIDKYLKSDTTESEATNSTFLTSFTSDGFVVGNNSVNNGSGETNVGWTWKAGGTGVSNTDGSITSTVSVGATSQQNWFSVATYTGTGSLSTVGHGLGVAPDMVIIKNRSGSPVPNWVIGNSASGWTGQLYFDTGAFSTNSGSFNNTAPTSSVVTINTDSTVNYNTGTYVMYSFANAEGLCKVGSYTGNGSTDGAFIHTGFRPAFVMVKRTDSANMWLMMDDKRYTYNVMGVGLRADTSGAEFGWNPSKDFLSNGFKVRTSDGAENASGGSYIFLAIASQPFKYANAR